MKATLRLRILTCLLASSLGTKLLANDAKQVSVFPPLGPPNMKFGTGGIVAGMPAMDPDLPFADAPASGWAVLQWRQNSYLKPREFTLDGPNKHISKYSWTSNFRDTELIVNQQGNHYSYRLSQKDGFVDSSGATDLFIAAKPQITDLALDNDLIFELSARITLAKIRYDTASAQTDGAVLAQIGAVFRTRFHDPETNQTFSVMIGVPISTSRHKRPDHLGCHFFGSSRSPQVVSVLSLADNPILPFEPHSQAPTKLSYSVSKLVCATIKASFPCKADDGSSLPFRWPQAAEMLKNWRVDSMTLGIETQNRFGNKGKAPEGHVEAGFEFSDLQVFQVAERSDRCSKFGGAVKSDERE